MNKDGNTFDAATKSAKSCRKDHGNFHPMVSSPSHWCCWFVCLVIGNRGLQMRIHRQHCPEAGRWFTGMLRYTEVNVWDAGWLSLQDTEKDARLRFNDWYREGNESFCRRPFPNLWPMGATGISQRKVQTDIHLIIGPVTWSYLYDWPSSAKVCVHKPESFCLYQNSPEWSYCPRRGRMKPNKFPQDSVCKGWELGSACACNLRLKSWSKAW